MLSFGDAIKRCFQKYATFSGRAPRSEYWWFVLFYMIGSGVLGFIDGIIFGFEETDPALFGMVFSLAVVVPSLAVTARRLHDTERSGWWMLAPYGAIFATGVFVAMELNIFAGAAGIAALVLVIVLLVWTIKIGTAGTNDYGPDPLGGIRPDFGDGDAGDYSRSRVPSVDRDD